MVKHLGIFSDDDKTKMKTEDAGTLHLRKEELDIDNNLGLMAH